MIRCQDTSDSFSLNVPRNLSAYYQNRLYSWWHPVRMPLTGVPTFGIQTLGHQDQRASLGIRRASVHCRPDFHAKPPPFDRFGLFLLKNSSKGRGPGRVLHVHRRGRSLPTGHHPQLYNNKQNLDFWNETRCNKVHGSDGASNPHQRD